MNLPISTRITMGIGFVGALAVALVALLVPIFVEDLVRQDALREAENNVEQIKILRGYYTDNVVAPITSSGGITPHYKHKDNDAFIPLPATMVHELSELYSKGGRTLDLYSKFPFPNRADRTLDQFKQEAWEVLSRDPDTTFSRSHQINEREILRVAIADIMTAETCVTCHNSHPDSPKRDWRLGEVRGVLEMQLDLTEDLAHAREFGWILALLMAAISIAGSFGLSVFMRKSVLVPMESISKAAQACADGNTSIDIVGVERRDEVGTLARSLDVFRKQADEVQRLNAERKQYLAELEDTVNARTRDLQTTAEELSASEAQFRTLVDNIPGIVYRQFVDTRSMDFISDNVAEITGYPASDFTNDQVRSFASIIHPDDLQLVKDAVAAGIEKREPYALDYRIVRADGVVRWLYEKCAGTLDEQGKASTIEGTIYDNTARKQAEEGLVDAFNTISSSIDYASKIQKSMLPASNLLIEQFDDHFVYWEPRDVVGGDVYWCHKWGEGTLIVLGDCTGHGVPGAFMTLISAGALERAMIDVTPGDVTSLVQRMHQILQTSIGQDTGDGDADDGLELGVCYIDAESRELTFVGARFELLVVNSGHVEVIRGNKKGIGYPEVPADFPFEATVVTVSPNSRFYMATDGVIDQIDNTGRQRFTKKRFRELLVAIQDMDMTEQRNAIHEAVIHHQGDAPRLDDIAVIGFSIGS